MGQRQLHPEAEPAELTFRFYPGTGWNMMAADFIKQVRMMPLKKIQTQKRAYSVYSGLLFFPKREITKSGASSKIRKKTVPISRTIFLIVLIVSFARSTFLTPHIKADDWLSAGSIYIFGNYFILLE